MFDLGRKLGPDSSSLSCPFMCPWCQLLLRTHFGEEVEYGQSSGTDKDGRLLLTIEEAAQRLGLGRSKTYQLAATGVLPYTSGAACAFRSRRSKSGSARKLPAWDRVWDGTLRFPQAGAAIGRHAARSRRSGGPLGPIGRDQEAERRSQ